MSIQSNLQYFLECCEHQKGLDKKTVKAYRIDLTQFSRLLSLTVKR